MFDKLNLCLEKLIKRQFPAVEAVEVSFERPSEDYAGKVSATATTVNAFLYDVREETQLRSNERSLVRSNGVVSVLPPFYVTFSYVITAWPVKGLSTADQRRSLWEQDLLGQVMQFLASQAEIPGDLAKNDFKCPVPLRISAIDEKGSLSEFWTALGNKIRPAFVLNATIALEPPFKEEKHPAATSLRVAIGPIDESDPKRGDPLYLIGGKVTLSNAAERGQPVRVKIEPLGRETSTDKNGLYEFRGVPGSGGNPYTLVAEKYVFDQKQKKPVFDANSRKTKSVYVPRSAQHPDDYDFTL